MIVNSLDSVDVDLGLRAEKQLAFVLALVINFVGSGIFFVDTNG